MERSRGLFGQRLEGGHVKRGNLHLELFSNVAFNYRSDVNCSGINYLKYGKQKKYNDDNIVTGMRFNDTDESFPGFSGIRKCISRRACSSKRLSNGEITASTSRHSPTWCSNLLL